MLSLMFSTYQRLFNKDNKIKQQSGFEIQFVAILTFTMIILFMLKLLTISGHRSRIRKSFSDFNFDQLQFSEDKSVKAQDSNDYDYLIKDFFDFQLEWDQSESKPLVSTTETKYN